MSRCRFFSRVAFFCLLVSLAGCSKKEKAAPAAVSVEAAAAQIQPITEHVVTDAVLAPVAQAAISPKITAPVKKFYVAARLAL